MKKSIYLIGLIAIVGLGSCSSSIEDAASGAEELLEEMNEPKIEGLWNLSDFDYGMEVPAEQQAQFDAMKQEMIENSNISFKEDGSFTQNDYMQEQMSTINGTYVLEGDKLTFTTDGAEQTMKVESLTTSEFVYSFEDNGQVVKISYARPTY
ncbi:MAG: lipocalin family protein [Crocinitomicaceae bacterium]